VLLANLQHFCNNNNIIILNYYYFIPGLFPSHSWWAESCSVRLSRGMVCNRQPRSFQGVDSHGQLDGWTEGWQDGWQDARIQGRFHFSSRRPLLYVIPLGTCHTWWKFFNKNSNQVYMLTKDLKMVNMGLYLNRVHLGSTSYMLPFSSSPFPQALPHT